jgi:hypothetical protein
VWLECKTIQVLCWSLSAVVENYGYIDDSRTQNSYNSHSLSGQRNLSASPSGLFCVTINSVQKQSLIMPQSES